VSWSVAGSFSRINDDTDWRLMRENPRSPRSAAPSHAAYCTYTGWSSPSRRRIAWADSLSAPSPMTTATASPGMIRKTKKTIAEIKNRIGTSSRRRRTMKVVTPSALFPRT
jgi:hypothetical protein